MGCRMGARCLFVVVLCLQMVAVVERQVFDFLGHMWTSIVANFLQIIFVIAGFFGACQHRPVVVTSYLMFSILWIAWNAFIICFYLNVGVLDRDSPILNMGTGSKSWWYSHGIGCHANETYDTTNHSTTIYVGCILQYYYVEVIHAGIQCLLSIAGILAGCCTLYVFRDDCDSAQPVDDELEYIHMHQPSHDHRTRIREMAPSLSTVQLSDSSMEQCQSDDRLYRQPQKRPTTHHDVVRPEYGITRLPSNQSDRLTSRTPQSSERHVSRMPQQSDRLASRLPQREMSEPGPPCYDDEYRLGIGNPTATFI